MNKSRRAIQLILCCVFSISLFACKQSMSTEPNNTIHGSIIPFALGSRWIYIDTLIFNSGTIVTPDTVSVQSVRNEGSNSWWKLHNTFNPSIAATEFLQTNDSVFSLQYTESISGLSSVISLEYIWLTVTDSSSFHSLFDGDAVIVKSVTRLKGGFTAPAGRFDNCAVFIYDIYPEHFREIVAYGVGVVSCEIQKDSTLSYGAHSYRKLILLNYTLNL